MTRLSQTKSHCDPFKDTTYPSIVALADDVYNYAQNAGGTVDDSYYGTKSCKRLHGLN